MDQRPLSAIRHNGTYYLLLTTYCLLLTAYYLPLTAYYLLLTTQAAEALERMEDYRLDAERATREASDLLLQERAKLVSQ